MVPTVVAGWVWWSVMTCVSTANFVILAVALRRASADAVRPAFERQLLRASAVIFTTVCAYRSALPRIDDPRVCWFDTPLSWIVFGRFAATFAEVAWAIHMGLTVRRLALTLAAGSKISHSLRRGACMSGVSVICMACFAECWSWANLITESNVFAVVEQALWSVLFLVTGAAVAALLRLWPQAPRSYWLFTIVAIGMGLEQAYEAFGLYLPRFISDQHNGVQYQDFVPGFQRLAACDSATQDISDWSGDAPWMTGYFSCGVWSSIWLAVAPLPSVPARFPLTA